MRLSVRISDTLRDTLDMFRNHRSMRLLAVLDDHNAPIGVIREIDVRDLLFNPYGHALMMNPGFGNDISKLVKSCALADHKLDNARLLAAYTQHADSPGLILTINGQFFETLSNDHLLDLVAQGRIARAEQIASRSQYFTEEILSLSGQLCETANQVRTLSEMLGEQADSMTEAAQNVASGAAQSSSGLQDVNQRGMKLAAAMEQLTAVASEAKQVRARTNQVICSAEPQMKALAVGGSEIGNIIRVIHDVGRKTNFLALNAQIEAVRQDSGSDGFVAVAGEIKELAGQTRGAAATVTQKVDNIGRAVGDVLAGHREIVDAMGQMSAISDRIDAAVAEHSVTSLVIAGYVDQAADATAEISTRAIDIGTRAQHVHHSASNLERVSADLLQSATNIRSRSHEFVQSIQAI
jgi:methyl-accepting chemotaxis protein